MMKGSLIFQILSFTLLSCHVFAKDGWSRSNEYMFEDKIYKRSNNICCFFNTDIALADREAMMDACHEYLKDNLTFINEAKLEDFIRIVFVRDREEMYKYTYTYAAGIFYPDEKKDRPLVFCVYDKKESPIKHELMHVVSWRKWGRVNESTPADWLSEGLACCMDTTGWSGYSPEEKYYALLHRGGISLTWLSEGLAVCADPATEWSEYSFEEKYAAFLQSNRLVDIDTLINSFQHTNMSSSDYLLPENYLQTRIRYNQAAYIVEYMIKNYGMDKVKGLWQNGMVHFEAIFGLKIKEMISEMHQYLNNKYPDPIIFDYDNLVRKCALPPIR